MNADFVSAIYQKAKLGESVLEHIKDRSKEIKALVKDTLANLKHCLLKEIREMNKISEDSLSKLYKVTDMIGTAARKKVEKEREYKGYKETDPLVEAKLYLIDACDPPPPDDIPTVFRVAYAFRDYWEELNIAISKHSINWERVLIDLAMSNLVDRPGDTLAHTNKQNNDYKK